jgi:hypothetical protein
MNAVLKDNVKVQSTGEAKKPKESLDKGSLSGSSELDRVPLAVNCL